MLDLVASEIGSISHTPLLSVEWSIKHKGPQKQVNGQNFTVSLFSSLCTKSAQTLNFLHYAFSKRIKISDFTPIIR
jgi:hypothetical protein